MTEKILVAEFNSVEKTAEEFAEFFLEWAKGAHFLAETKSAIRKDPLGNIGGQIVPHPHNGKLVELAVEGAAVFAHVVHNHDAADGSLRLLRFMDLDQEVGLFSYPSALSEEDAKNLIKLHYERDFLTNDDCDDEDDPLEAAYQCFLDALESSYNIKQIDLPLFNFE